MRNQIAPAELLPSQFTIKGEDYTITSVNVVTNVVEIKNTKGKYFNYDYYELKRKVTVYN